MKLSVIVATYNRKHELEELFASFSQQTLSPEQFEVIIVDDGSTDRTDKFIHALKSKLPFSIQYHYQKNKGPGKARTLGMQKAIGDVLIFIDSDCIAPPHYLQTIKAAFEKTEIDAFGGPDKSAEAFSAWDKAVNYTMTSFMTTGGLRGSSGKKLARYYPRSFNMGLRREVFEKIGGFGSIYHYGEDIEFSHRIIQTGAKVEYLNDAYVYHKRRSSPAAFVKQIYKMGKARVQLARIDRSMLEPLHLLPAILIILAGIILFGALFSTIFKYLLLFVVIAGLLGVIVLTVHGSMKTKSIAAGLYIPAAFILQIAAYGIGMIKEFISAQ